jgi:hypothetical protein
MMWEAVYKNEKGEIRVPLVESGKKFYLESEGGTLEDFVPVLKDAALGEVRHVKTIAANNPAPMPYDPAREKSIEVFKQKLRTAFKSNESFQAFLNAEAKLRRAIDNNFDGVPISTIQEWSTRIGEATAEPDFTIEEKRRRFTGQEIGDLFIENETIASSASNNWNGEYGVRCQRCRQLTGYTIKVLDILKMQRGLIPLWKCAYPCWKGR